MDICVIDGKSYNVHIMAIKESYSILYSDKTGRTLSRGARMVLDPLGTFFSYNVTFRVKDGDYDSFNSLYRHLYQPRFDGITVKLVHDDATLEFDAYTANGDREVRRVNAKTGLTEWGDFSANFVPMEAQVVPS